MRTGGETCVVKKLISLDQTPFRPLGKLSKLVAGRLTPSRHSSLTQQLLRRSCICTAARRFGTAGGCTAGLYRRTLPAGRLARLRAWGLRLAPGPEHLPHRLRFRLRRDGLLLAARRRARNPRAQPRNLLQSRRRALP